ncbi:TIGR02117 family protein [Ruegeria atlantica]|uniref:TIGR02117 family protein n=1 Tax=Ruegeria atlantica TaxID=81569 RepID=UPI00147DA6C4|nr:TIGR02117 family protein [Ruegeria atlantica]
MRKAGLRIGLSLFAPIGVYFLAATLGAVIPGNWPKTAGPGTIEVQLIRGPIHYDFLIPLTPATRNRLDDLRRAGVPVDQPEMQWLMVGWGAREFYTTAGTYADVTIAALLKGLTGDQSVLRVDAFGPLRPDLDLPHIRMDRAQFALFLDAVDASFSRSDQGHLVPLQVAGFSATDRFFVANGRFDLFRTCNVWIGEVLRDADVRFGLWVPLPFSVTLSRWLYQSVPE